MIAMRRQARSAAQVRRLAAALTLSVAALLPSAAQAHPMGNFSINHYTRIIAGARTVELDYIIDMAEIPTFQEIQERGLITRPGDAALAKYLARQAETLKGKLTLEADAHVLALECVSRQAIFPPGAGGLPTMKMGFVYRAALPHPIGHAPCSLRYSDANFQNHTGWKEIIAIPAASATIISSTVPTHDRSDALSNYPTDMLHSPPQTVGAILDFRAAPIMPADSSGAQAAARTPGLGLLANRRSTPHNAFTELITSNRADLTFFMMAAFIAAVLGGFHAFEPGHGKTIVAAYLVGSRGTARHAVLLGTVVTASHTVSVYALGLITLYASQWIVPERLYPWLGLASGLFVAILGAGLFLRRFARSESHKDVQPRAHRPDHPHYGDPLAHRHTWWGGHVAADRSSDVGHGYSHDHGHDHEHSHLHRHQHVHGIDYAHDHARDHAQSELGSVDRASSVAPDLPGGVSLKSLFALGITGGIVPCPAALVVLLGALAIHRIAFGLFLIVAFSAGLALVLVSFGLAMVYARKFIGRFNAHGPLTERWLPLASSAAIAMIGLTITLQSLTGVLKVRL